MEKDGETVVQVAMEMTLDEWRALQEIRRPKVEFNIRKTENQIPSKAKVIHQSKQLEVRICWQNHEALMKVELWFAIKGLFDLLSVVAPGCLQDLSKCTFYIPPLLPARLTARSHMCKCMKMIIACWGNMWAVLDVRRTKTSESVCSLFEGSSAVIFANGCGCDFAELKSTWSLDANMLPLLFFPHLVACVEWKWMWGEYSPVFVSDVCS